ncbi:hypothetical protein DFH27DRAFT_21579 [Peziza echinospora]|nr:hypothetical protein DFH27DRAFT_21579 [Peziza echinospora]
MALEEYSSTVGCLASGAAVLVLCLLWVGFSYSRHGWRDVSHSLQTAEEKVDSNGTASERGIYHNEKVSTQESTATTLYSTSTSTSSTAQPSPSLRRNSLRRLSLSTTSTLIRNTIAPKLTTLFTSGGRRDSVDADLLSPLSPSQQGESASPGFPAGHAPKTKEEREAIGKYPDYETLSGVSWPNECKGFDPDRSLPRPYRPFRWKYHQTMALSKMEPDWWLELESTYKSRIHQRKQLYLQHGKNVLDWLPGEDVAVACRESMELVVMWLVKRYPRHFELVDDDMEDVSGDDRSKGTGKVLVNHILGIRTPLDRRDIHPLKVLLYHVPEDFAIVLPEITYPAATPENPIPQPTIRHTFRGGVICSAIGWHLGTKLGLSLHDIHHTTGNVPDYASKLSFSMDRFFSRSLPPHKPIQRGSWSLEIGQPLFAPPDDPHHLKLRSFQNPELKAEDVYLRVDWQTLRRLPISGAVLFNYKAVFTAVTEFKYEPRIPKLFGTILRGGSKNILEYKGTWHVEHVVVPLMEEYARWQVEEGLAPEEDETMVATLEQSPFFEGWEGRWRERERGRRGV